MRSMKRMGLIILCAALLLGCSKLTRENYDKIEMGMEMTQVIAIIGEPDTCNGAMGAKKCIWGDEKKNITIAFVGDHVTLHSMAGL